MSCRTRYVGVLLLVCPLVFADTALPLGLSAHSDAHGHQPNHEPSHEHGHGHHAPPGQPPVSMPATDGRDGPWPTAEAVAAAFPDLGGMPVHAAHTTHWQLQVSRLEWQAGDGDEALAWQVEAWWGGERDRLYLQGRGERSQGRSDSLQSHLAWQRFLTPWWASRLGVRQDGGPRSQRRWLTAGLHGHTPWFVNTGVTLAVAEGGHAELRLAADYTWRLTQRWLLASDLELTLRSREDGPAGLARGWSRTEAGLQLRYQIRPDLTPYVGLEWTHYPGRSADRMGEGERRRLVAGLRFWF